MGFSAKGVKGNKEAFFSEFPLPCIAHVIVDGNLLHYVVIHKITKKQVIIADPGVGIVKLKPEEFFGEVHEDGKTPKYQWSGVLILLVKNETFKKGDETKGLFSRFFYLLLPQKKLLFHIFVASLVYTILGILGAFYFKELIDNVLPDGLRKTLITLSIGVILLNVFKVILNAFRSHLLLYLSQKLDIALLLGYYRHVIELPMNFFGTRKVGEIISRFNDAGKVDVLVCNAGIGISGAAEFVPETDYKAQTEVNFNGAVASAQAVIPAMRQAGRGKIVFISSLAAIFPLPFQGFYSATKAALNAFSDSLGIELKPFGVETSAVMLNDVKTDFTENRRKTAIGDDIYEGRIEASVSKMEKSEQNGMTPEQVAHTVSSILKRKHLPPHKIVGFSNEILGFLFRILPTGILLKLLKMIYG